MGVLKEGKSYLLGNHEKPHVKVKLEEIKYSSSGIFPADYWFSYDPSVKNEDKPIVHPNYGKDHTILHEVVFMEPMIPLLLGKGVLKEIE